MVVPAVVVVRVSFLVVACCIVCYGCSALLFIVGLCRLLCVTLRWMCIVVVRCCCLA